MGYTKEEIQQSIDDGNYWLEIAKDTGFTLYGFTFRDSAHFHTPNGNVIIVTKEHLEFFKNANIK